MQFRYYDRLRVYLGLYSSLTFALRLTLQSYASDDAYFAQNASFRYFDVFKILSPYN